MFSAVVFVNINDVIDDILYFRIKFSVKNIINYIVDILYAKLDPKVKLN